MNQDPNHALSMVRHPPEPRRVTGCLGFRILDHYLKVHGHVEVGVTSTLNLGISRDICRYPRCRTTFVQAPMNLQVGLVKGSWVHI